MQPFGTKTPVRTVDKASAINNWWKIKGKAIHLPQVSSGFRVKQKGIGRGREGALAYLVSICNNVNSNTSNVCLLTSPSTVGHGCSITAANWHKAVAVFAARKLVVATWINNYDEYCIPSNTSSEAFHRWLSDAHVWSLLPSKNNVVSLREVTYQGKTWNLPNHFFWLTREQGLDLFNTAETQAEYEDAQVAEKDPHFATVLPTLTLGPTATTLLAKLNELVVASLPMRRAFDDESPEYQVRNWDAGVYQLKEVWKRYYSEEWKALQALRDQLASELLPGVYEFGFLRA